MAQIGGGWGRRGESTYCTESSSPPLIKGNTAFVLTKNHNMLKATAQRRTSAQFCRKSQLSRRTISQEIPEQIC